MKKIGLLFIVAIVSGQLWAQDEGIKFMDNPKWSDVLELSAKEDKLIFVDCYTTWCGPCKGLAKDVFPTKLVGDYFNPKFINVKMDMEKGDGVDLNKKYKQYIPGYPTMMLINSKGEVVHRVVGYQQPDALVKAVQDGLDGKTLDAMKARYDKGERSVEFISDYLEVLNSLFMRDEMAQLALSYIGSLPLEDLKKKEIIELYEPYIKDIYSPQFDFIMSNISHYNYRLKDGFDRYELSEKLNSAMSRAVKDIVSYKKGNDGEVTPIEPSKDEIAKIRNYFSRYNFKDKQQFDVQLKIHVLKSEGEYQKAIDYLKAGNELGVLGYSSQLYLVENAWFFLNHTDDKKLLKQMLSMIELVVAALPDDKRADEFNTYFALSGLSKKIGDKKKAQEYEEIAKKGEEKMKLKFEEFFKK